MKQLNRAEHAELLATWWYYDLCRRLWQRGRHPVSARWQKRKRRRASRRVGKLLTEVR